MDNRSVGLMDEHLVVNLGYLKANLMGVRLAGNLGDL